jgi:hypothetical protein
MLLAAWRGQETLAPDLIERAVQVATEHGLGSYLQVSLDDFHQRRSISRRRLLRPGEAGVRGGLCRALADRPFRSSEARLARRSQPGGSRSAQRLHRTMARHRVARVTAGHGFTRYVWPVRRA